MTKNEHRLWLAYQMLAVSFFIIVAALAFAPLVHCLNWAGIETYSGENESASLGVYFVAAFYAVCTFIAGLLWHGIECIRIVKETEEDELRKMGLLKALRGKD